MQGTGHRLPDMACNVSILTLILPRYEGFRYGDDWLCLPPKLCHLHGTEFLEGPPATAANGKPALASLLSLIVGEQRYINPRVLAQILQAAPCFQTFEGEDEHDKSITIECELHQSCAADFAVLDGRRELWTTAKFWFNYFDAGDEHTLQPVIATMPIMRGVTRCRLTR